MSITPILRTVFTGRRFEGEHFLPGHPWRLFYEGSTYPSFPDVPPLPPNTTDALLWAYRLTLLPGHWVRRRETWSGDPNTTLVWRVPTGVGTTGCPRDSVWWGSLTRKKLPLKPNPEGTTEKIYKVWGVDRLWEDGWYGGEKGRVCWPGRNTNLPRRVEGTEGRIKESSHKEDYVEDVQIRVERKTRDFWIWLCSYD